MLSKSQARTFFLLGTLACGGTFIALTIDSFGRIPDQTHEATLTPEAIRGKDLWDSSNCMGCHTLFGEGAYYAPELTRVYTRRGPVFLRQMLKDPEAMYPGQRRMWNYHFTDAELDALVAFFKWTDQVDLNGFPPAPRLMQVAVPGGDGALAKRSNRPQIINQLCVACHAIEGQGGAVGPALDGVGSRRDAAWLRTWLHDPLAVKPDTKMPKLPLDDAQIDELVAYLSQLQTSEKAP